MQIRCFTTQLFFLRFYLFIFRQTGMEGEKEGEKHQWVIAAHAPQAYTLIGSRTGDPLVLRPGSLSHVECEGCTVHRLTQQHLPPPLTSTMRPSLFTHVHSSPLSLAARLYQCCANCSHYINNEWTFSEQTSYILNIKCSIS